MISAGDSAFPWPPGTLYNHPANEKDDKYQYSKPRIASATTAMVWFASLMLVVASQ
jgi:hypothetical protein